MAPQREELRSSDSCWAVLLHPVPEPSSPCSSPHPPSLPSLAHPHSHSSLLSQSLASPNFPTKLKA